MLELGRYLVGESGVYVCRVIDRKISRGQVFLVTDGGLHHHLAASGNFGQVLRKNYPALIGNRVHGAQREKASIVGPLCTPLDLLADRMEMAKADAGDLAVVLQSGAYGLTASPLGFLSHPRAGRNPAVERAESTRQVLRMWRNATQFGIVCRPCQRNFNFPASV